MSSNSPLKHSHSHSSSSVADSLSPSAKKRKLCASPTTTTIAGITTIDVDDSSSNSSSKEEFAIDNDNNNKDNGDISVAQIVAAAAAKINSNKNTTKTTIASNLLESPTKNFQSKVGDSESNSISSSSSTENINNKNNNEENNDDKRNLDIVVEANIEKNLQNQIDKCSSSSSSSSNNNNNIINNNKNKIERVDDSTQQSPSCLVSLNIKERDTTGGNNKCENSSSNISNRSALEVNNQEGSNGQKEETTIVNSNSDCLSLSSSSLSLHLSTSQIKESASKLENNHKNIVNNCGSNSELSEFNSKAPATNNSGGQMTGTIENSTNSAAVQSSGNLSSTVTSTNNDIDESLYSRQLYVLGHDAMRRMANSDILLSGLNGLGLEIAKNVILGGVKSITLHDQANCTIRDLATQFYLTKANIGQNRAEASRSHLAELNNYVSTTAYTGELTEEFLKKFRVIVLADSTYEEQHRIASFAHDHGIAIIIAETRGLFAKIFCDFGENFTIYDQDGAQPVSTMIASVTHDTEGVITCLDETRHGFNDDDYVTFSEIQGMTELNGCAPIKIKVLGPYTFSIGDTTKYGEYISGGIATQVKMPKKMSFKSYADAEKNPEFMISDFAKFDQPATLHAAFPALHKFVEEYGRMPKPWNQEDALKVLDLAKAINPDINEETVLTFAKIAAGNTCPLDAAIGGFVSQEVLKACTGKFTPINQWLYYDAVECLPDNGVTEEDAQPLNCRYDAQIAIFGKQFQDKLGDQKYFIVGAGAIGCELIKNLAMIGLGARNGKIFITDMDLIEKSNLNRQFLFRPHDVQKAKAITAVNAIKKMNPEANLQAYELRVGSETEKVFSEEFYGNLNGITNALDNVDARIYMDRKAVFNRLPLIESGTLGTMGNVQVVVPFKTESYSSTQDPPEKNIPICTLKNFPNAIEHTLQWARDAFEGIFTQAPENSAQYLNDSQFIERTLKLQGVTPLEILESVKKGLVDEKPETFADCVRWARLLWEEYYANQIKQLLYNFPPDQQTSSGQPFWSGPKRCPTPLEYSADDPLHLDFVYAAANLKAEVYNIPQVRNRATVYQLVNEVKVPEFKPRSGVRIETNENAAQAAANNADDSEVDQDRVNKILTELEKLDKGEFKVKSLEFEKDDDNNLHMDFIVAASNLRASNYKIPHADRHKSKLIAGKIIPAIATSTSAVSGFAVLEVIKLAQGHSDLAKFKNVFLNLALPFLASSEPMQAAKNKYYENEWTLWDRFEVQGELTLQEFLDHFEKKERLKITMLSQGVSMLYSFFMPKAKCAERLPLLMSEVVRRVSKRRIEPHERSLVFEICCNDDEDEDVEVPYVRYTLP